MDYYRPDTGTLRPERCHECGKRFEGNERRFPAVERPEAFTLSDREAERRPITEVEVCERCASLIRERYELRSKGLL
jgi:hypothetical protein